MRAATTYEVSGDRNYISYQAVNAWSLRNGKKLPEFWIDILVSTNGKAMTRILIMTGCSYGRYSLLVEIIPHY